MNIHPVSNNFGHPHFGTVYASNTALSKRQENITKFLIKEFRGLKSYLKGDTLEKYYQNKGYDFIIRPYGNELVTLDAYKGLKIEKSAQGKHAIFNQKDEKHIGRYDEYAAVYLADDLMISF